MGRLAWSVSMESTSTEIGWVLEVCFRGDYDFGTDGCYFDIFRERMYFKLGKEYDCSGHKH